MKRLLDFFQFMFGWSAKQPQGDWVAPASQAASTAPAGPLAAATVDERGDYAGWVDACVFMFGTAAVLSVLGGVVVALTAGDGGAAIVGLIGGALVAAVWVGMAVGLLLLHQIATGIQTLTKTEAVKLG